MTSSTRPPDSSNRLFLLGLVALVVVGMAAVAFLATRDRGGTADQTAQVEVVGDVILPMPPNVGLTTPDTDPEAGATFPTVTGTGFDGAEITIEADGRPKAVYFLAHWCPHCQEEVPVIQGLIDDGQVPDGVDVYAISTAVDATRGNHPPQTWLEDAGFDPPTLRDDGSNSAYVAAGGSGFPYAVYLDGQNRVVARTAGNVPAATLTQLWEQLAVTGG